MHKIILVLLTLTISAMAADFTGKWSGSFKTDDGEQPAYLILKQDGDSLTGSGGPNESEQHPINSGKVDGQKMVFDVATGKGTIHMELTAEGDTLKGKMEMKRDDGETRSAIISVKRV
jgi:hypothetical protein